MRRKWGGAVMETTKTLVVLLVVLSLSATCDARRRQIQRRKDTMHLPTPSMETLSELAEAMGAAEFEHHTEGKTLVKRLIPENSEPDLDVISYQGVIGKAGVDFPAFPNIPVTGFNCRNVLTGYYADLETDCQVFHICDSSRKISFLCPNGTIFSQSHLICDWWFKVDCASSPALYESSAEYYSNEQKKTHKITQSLSKNVDLQQINSDNSNIRTAIPRKILKEVNPTTTERFLRHRQRLQGLESIQPIIQDSKSGRSYQPIKPETPTPEIIEARRKSLVQLVKNVSPAKTTLPTYTDASTYRGDYKEMQVAAESASFADSNNRKFLQSFNKEYRPYPVYTPTTPKTTKPNPNPTLTTLFVFDKNGNSEVTTKRSTLLPYSKSYTNNFDKHEPYTRPGVSLLKDYLEKRKNNSASEGFSKDNKPEESYETVTKFSQTTRSDTFFPGTEKYIYTDNNRVTAEPTYKERRERLMRKLNLDNFTTETTVAITPSTEKSIRPGLVVPPSLTPKTLHSLAIYYATALDNLASTPAPESLQPEASTSVFDEYEPIDDLPALFSKQTINKYTKLFNQGADNSELLEEMKLDTNGTYNDLNDLSGQQSQNPLSSSPQIRELAQIFTHALSAYLQDPVKFRKVLSEIRPTQPPLSETGSTDGNTFNTEPTTTINEDEEEILGFSDDNKIRPALSQFREPKAYTPNAVFPKLTETKTTETYSTEDFTNADTSKSVYKCCGRISASYTTAATVRDLFTTPLPYTSLSQSRSDSSESTNTYLPKMGGFQNNTPPVYGQDEGKYAPLTEYLENTNVPSAWGIDADTTKQPFITAEINSFESKKIKATTYNPVSTTPTYFTEAENIETENEEELQRAHSQSFVSSNDNNLQRQGKQFKYNKDNFKSLSENLEAPTVTVDYETTTPEITTLRPSTFYIEETEAPSTESPEASDLFTGPVRDKSRDLLTHWTRNFDNWQSTVVLDPITLNDGLSATGPEKTQQQYDTETTAWESNTATDSATAITQTPTLTDITETSELSYSSSKLVEFTTPSSVDNRKGRLLNTTPEPSESTTISESVVEKAKEIMGGMNATTQEKLMNVMKKTKSKTVKRLILLLVQTCDDDHNSTAEASKKALLDALMTVSQKDMDEVEKEQENTEQTKYEERANNDIRRTDKYMETEEIKPNTRAGKSINFDPKVINSLSSTNIAEKQKSENVQTQKTTPSPFTKITAAPIRRGTKKFIVRTSPIDNATGFTAVPRAEARVAPSEDIKGETDTRAVELLRSLYSIAAKWG